MAYMPPDSPIKGFSFDKDRIAYIKQYPEITANFVVTWKRMEKWVEKSGIKNHALEQIRNGTKLTGLRLANHPSGSQYIQLE